jgi:hypothetical protein
MPLIGNVDKVTRTYVAGWIADSENPGQPIDVLIYVGGEGRGRVTADLQRDDLRGAFPGATGNHAFRFEFGWALSPFRQHEVEVIAARERHLIAGGKRTLPRLGAQDRTAPAPVCVTSTGRAGSSLLMGRLAAHPEIAVAGTHPYEIKQLTYYALTLRTLSLEANWNRSMNPDAMMSDASRYFIGFNPFHDPHFGEHPLLDRYWDVTGHAILTSAFRDMVLAYYDAIRAMMDKQRVQYFAEKTHPNPLIRDGAIGMFGGVKEIVLVRDPRDLVCSYRKFWGSKPAEAVSLIRSQFAELAERVRAAEPDTLLVRYEDLVLDPGQTLGRICALLELEAGPTEQREAEAATFQRHGTSGSPQESIGRWRHELTAEERELCERSFAGLLPVLGYGANE